MEVEEVQEKQGYITKGRRPGPFRVHKTATEDNFYIRGEAGSKDIYVYGALACFGPLNRKQR